MTELSLKSPSAYLQNLRENWLLSEEARTTLEGRKISYSSKCIIDGKEWDQNIYSDFSGIKKFVIFELSRNRILSNEHHCLGCEIIKGGYSLITNEQLWKEGIP
jgi:hypothetical protein